MFCLLTDLTRELSHNMFKSLTYDDGNKIIMLENITLGLVEKMLDIRCGSNWYGFCICLIQAYPDRKIPVDKHYM